MYLVVFFIKLQNVMKQLKISQMAIVIVATTLFFSCSKPDLTDTKGGGTSGTKVASFTSPPVLTPDTIYARTAGATLAWGSSYATNTSISVGTLSDAKSSATMPALEKSTSCTITLVSEDGSLVTRTVPLPVFDTAFGFITKFNPRWKMASAIRYYPGGQVNLPLDPDITIYYRDMYNGGRKGITIHNGVEYPGTWYHLNNGAQYGDGMYVWDNSFPNPTTWVRTRTDGTNTWVVTCVVIP